MRAAAANSRKPTGRIAARWRFASRKPLAAIAMKHPREPNRPVKSLAYCFCELQPPRQFHSLSRPAGEGWGEGRSRDESQANGPHRGPLSFA